VADSSAPPAPPAPSVGGPSVSPSGPAMLAAPHLAVFSSIDIYLVIIVGAVVLFGSLMLVRILGVKTTWI
jgi:hypothetical protein